MIVQSQTSKLLGLMVLALAVMFMAAGCSDDDETTPTGNDVVYPWVPENVQPESGQYTAMSFASEMAGWMVGVGGTIIYTDDGGETWYKQNSGTVADLYDIYAISPDSALIVGDEGTLLYSFDAGAHWLTAIGLATNDNLRSISGSGGSEYWAVGDGGRLIYSNTHGLWWELGSSGTMAGLNDVTFFGGTGFVVGDDGTILKSTQAGDGTWSPWSAVANGATENLNSVCLSSASTGWTVGDAGTIMMTTDGNAFGLQTSGSAVDLNEVFCNNNIAAWAVGDAGTILNTSDGGASWATVLADGKKANLNAVEFSAGGTGWIAGDFTILRATPSPAMAWSSISSITSDLPTLTDITWLDNNTGFAVGYNGSIIRTRTGGATWEYLFQKNDAWFDGVEFIDANTGWCVGGRGVQPYNAYIIMTDDGGETWMSQSIEGLVDTFYCSSSIDTSWGPDPFGIQDSIRTIDTVIINSEIDTTWIHSLDMVSATDGWAVGGNWTDPEGGAVLHTVDGGGTWYSIPTFYDTVIVPLPPDDPCWPNGQTSDTVYVNNTARYNGLCFISANEGWIAGNFGVILHTADGGSTWEIQNFDADSAYNLLNIHFMDASNGWAIGSMADSLTGSMILHTTDGGTTWSTQDGGTLVPLVDLDFASATSGWIVGAGGTVLFTDNAGATWTEQMTGLTVDLLGVAVTDDPNVCWIVGEDGLVMRTETGGNK